MAYKLKAVSISEVMKFRKKDILSTFTTILTDLEAVFSCLLDQEKCHSVQWCSQQAEAIIGHVSIYWKRNNFGYAARLPSSLPALLAALVNSSRILALARALTHANTVTACVSFRATNGLRKTTPTQGFDMTFAHGAQFTEWSNAML